MAPLYRLIFLLWLLAPVTALAAQPVIPVPTENRAVVLDHNVWIHQDTTHRLTIASLLRPEGAALFQPSPSPFPNFGYTSGNQHAHPVWVRFQLRNGSDQPQALFCEVDFWAFDELQLFIADSSGVVYTSPIYGWKTPVGQKYVYHRNYFFPFTLPGGKEVTCYLRALKRRGVQVIPITIRPQGTLDTYVLRDYGFWGGIFSIFLFVIVISFFFYLTTFDRIYWKYILCVLGLAGYFFINDGFLYQFFFDSQFRMPNRNVYFLFPLLLFFFQLLFVRSFLSLENTPSRLWHRVGTVALVGGAFCLSSLLLERLFPFSSTVETWLMRLFIVFYWLPMPLIWTFIIVNLVRRYRVQEAWLYLVAVTPFYALNFLVIFCNFGLLPTYPFLESYENFALAALFEVVVLTFGLAYRYKLTRDRNEQLNEERNQQQRVIFEAELQALQLRNESLQEKERIARDLHDNVGAQLSFIVTSLQQIARQAEKQPVTNSRQWSTQLRAIVDYTREAIKMLRETIWAIHQESFTLEEFEDRINHYVSRYFQQMEQLQILIRAEGQLAQPLTSVQALNMFRIVQEALHNVVKHARATEVRVLLRADPDGPFHLSISDNGHGLAWNPDDGTDHHYGLQNMKKRAEELGGRFRIYSDHGTVVEVAV
ncbi:sensor histidine kinase [Larkinella soli]|uniref:sensor histidine kinase n=1 Tax=Larkinella soli TaxID=1770527 RepID=UPI000FFB79C9|nr:7TM-DISM domain-containing protein [Larkinella soli]